MTIVADNMSLINSPIVVALVSVAATALVALAVAGLKAIIQLAQIMTEIKAIRQDIADMKADPDVMRWSNYGRAERAFHHTQSELGGN